MSIDIKNSSSKRRVIATIFLYTCLIGAALLTLFPYIWMILTSFKEALEAESLELKLLPENFFYFKNFKDLFALEGQNISLLRGMLNTFIVEIAVIPVGTVVSALAAFSFSKMRLPHKRTLLLVLMSSMMVPYAALLLPQYRAYSNMEWTGTLLPIIVAGWFGNISMMFFFIQYLRSIPNSLIEAGRIDGANWLRVFFSVVMPSMMTAIAAQVIFWFLGIWNDYFAPSIYLTGSNWMTLQALLAVLNDNQKRRANIPLVMAGSTISSIPILIIYIMFQKYFIQSLALSGIKD